MPRGTLSRPSQPQPARSMSEFESLAVLVSLILGLRIAHLLRGIERLTHRGDHARPDAVDMIWTGAVFWTLILNWWVFFQSQTVAECRSLEIRRFPRRDHLGGAVLPARGHPVPAHVDCRYYARGAPG